MKLQYNFPKVRGGSKAVWNFSENSSDLVAEAFPKRDVFLSCPRAIPAIITSSKRDLKKAVKFRVEQLSAFYQDNARLLLRYKIQRCNIVQRCNILLGCNISLIKCKILLVSSKSLVAHGQGNGKIINLNICISDIARIG